MVVEGGRWTVTHAPTHEVQSSEKIMCVQVRGGSVVGVSFFGG